MYVQAKNWGITPSEVLGIEDVYVAFCFNQACGYLGAWVESKLDDVKPGKKPKDTVAKKEVLLNKLLDPNPDARFASPPGATA